MKNKDTFINGIRSCVTIILLFLFNIIYVIFTFVDMVTCSSLFFCVMFH